MAIIMFVSTSYNTYDNLQKKKKKTRIWNLTQTVSKLVEN
jgi:hypothetical protein